MSATRDGRGTKVVPLELRQAVARAVENAIRDRFKGKSEQAIATALGISQSALNKIRHCNGALGLNALLDLRLSLHMTIDELLGLEPLAKPAPPRPPSKLTAEQLEQVRELMRAERAAQRPDGSNEEPRPVRPRAARRP